MIEKTPFSEHLLEAPLDGDDDPQMVELSWLIYEAESKIDPNRPLYLMTYAPNPAELPDCDFGLQHSFVAPWLIDYLKGCYSGCFCVESTQLGSPHYHGWYQHADDPRLEELRIIYVKTLQRYGILKITRCKVAYKINSYSKKGNALHYYKKDLYNSTLYYKFNPITEDTVVDINWDSMLYNSFFTKRLNKDLHIDQILSAYKFTVQFYTDSS